MRPIARTLLYDGKERSILEISILSGIPLATIYTRLYRGVDPLVSHRGQPKGKTGRPTKTHLFEGFQMPIREISQKIGIHPECLKWRIAQWGLEKALTTPAHQRGKSNGGAKAKLHLFEGEMLTVKQIAQKEGVSVYAIYDRLGRPNRSRPGRHKHRPDYIPFDADFQGARDRQYAENYATLVAQMPESDRDALIRLGLDKPETPRYQFNNRGVLPLLSDSEQEAGFFGVTEDFATHLAAA
jgi:hypothetical protein